MLLATLEDVEYAMGAVLSGTDRLRMDRLLHQANALVLGYLRMPEPSDPAAIPEVLRETVIEITLRAHGAAATPPGVRRQSTGPFSIEWTDQASQGGIYLTDADRMVLAPYRRSGMSVPLTSERY